MLSEGDIEGVIGGEIIAQLEYSLQKRDSRMPDDVVHRGEFLQHIERAGYRALATEHQAADGTEDLRVDQRRCVNHLAEESLTQELVYRHLLQEGDDDRRVGYCGHSPRPSRMSATISSAVTPVGSRDLARSSHSSETPSWTSSG